MWMSIRRKILKFQYHSIGDYYNDISAGGVVIIVFTICIGLPIQLLVIFIACNITK